MAYSKTYTTASGSFTVSQAYSGAGISFQPLFGCNLEMALNDYVSGNASLADKRAQVTIEFCMDRDAAQLHASSQFLYDNSFDEFITTMPNSAQSAVAPSVPKSKTSRISKSKAPKKSAAKSATSTRNPGYLIMTRDGRDITDCASRGPKTTEQRQSAAKMRRMGACESCRRSKQRCDPSHPRKASSTPASATISTPSSIASSHRRGSIQPQTSFESVDPPMFTSAADESLAGLDLFGSVEDSMYNGDLELSDFDFSKDVAAPAPHMPVFSDNSWNYTSNNFSQESGFSSFTYDSSWSATSPHSQLDTSGSFGWDSTSMLLQPSLSQSSTSSPTYTSVDSSPLNFVDFSPSPQGDQSPPGGLGRSSGPGIADTSPPSFVSSAGHDVLLPSGLQSSPPLSAPLGGFVSDKVLAISDPGDSPPLGVDQGQASPPSDIGSSPLPVSSSNFSNASTVYDDRRGREMRGARGASSATHPWKSVVRAPTQQSGLADGLGAQILSGFADFYGVSVSGVLSPSRAENGSALVMIGDAPDATLHRNVGDVPSISVRRSTGGPSNVALHMNVEDSVDVALRRKSQSQPTSRKTGRTATAPELVESTLRSRSISSLATDTNVARTPQVLVHSSAPQLRTVESSAAEERSSRVKDTFKKSQILISTDSVAKQSAQNTAAMVDPAALATAPQLTAAVPSAGRYPTDQTQGIMQTVQLSKKASKNSTESSSSPSSSPLSDSRPGPLRAIDSLETIAGSLPSAPASIIPTVATASYTLAALATYQTIAMMGELATALLTTALSISSSVDFSKTLLPSQSASPSGYELTPEPSLWRAEPVLVA